MHGNSPDRAERDAVLVLSDLIRKIDRGREAVLQSAGDHAFGYTAEAAEEVSRSIEETLALCRRCESVLQMWSALSAATAAADMSTLAFPSIAPLADEVRRAVAEFEVVAEAARSSMVQVGSRKLQGPRRRPEGWADRFGRPMVEKSWDQLFAMQDEDLSAPSPLLAAACGAAFGSPLPSGALGIWSSRLAERGSTPSACALGARSAAAAASHSYTSSSIEGAFLEAAQAMAAASGRAPATPCGYSGAPVGSSSTSACGSSLNESGVRWSGEAEAEVQGLVEGALYLSIDLSVDL